MDTARGERSAIPQVLDDDRDENSHGEGGLETHRVQRVPVAPPPALKRQFPLASHTLNSHCHAIGHSKLGVLGGGGPSAGLLQARALMDQW